MREEQCFACVVPSGADRSTICGNPRPIIAVTISSSEAPRRPAAVETRRKTMYIPRQSSRAGSAKAPRAVGSRTCGLAMSVAHQQTGTEAMGRNGNPRRNMRGQPDSAERPDQRAIGARQASPGSRKLLDGHIRHISPATSPHPGNGAGIAFLGANRARVSSCASRCRFRRQLWPPASRSHAGEPAPPVRPSGRSSAAPAARASPISSTLPEQLVDDRQRRVGRRNSRPRLVVADRLARSRLRHVGGQPRRVQGAVDRHLRQRLRRGAARSRGCPRTRSSSASSAATSS